MNNKLVDQKRRSLDYSESSSEDDESRRRDYLDKNGLAESYNSQEQPYSPDADSTDKPTPQSKENISAFKGSDNIYIKGNSNEKNLIYQDYTDDKYRPGDSSLSSSKGGEYKSPEQYGSSEDEGTEAKLSSKYASDDYGKEANGFKNRLVVGNANDQGPTDFKRAHVRKLQQEREQELYSKAVRESADAVREKWLLEKAKRSLDAEDLVGDKEGGKDKLSRIEEDERDRSYGQSDSKAKVIRDSDTGARFEKIKNQVRDLEQNLNSYSKNLTKSSIKQKDRSQNLDRVYGDFEASLREAKDELEQSLNNKKGAYEERERGYNSRGFSADRNRSDKKNKLEKTKSTHASSVKKERKSTEIGKQTRGPSSTYKKLQEEISRLTYQNDLLRERLGDDEDERPRRTAQPGPDIDREKDLIDTIERIKKKLRHSMAEKGKSEKEQEIAEIQEDAAAKSFGRNYTTLGVSHKDIFMRKTYGDTTYNKENSQSSYKGRTSASKAYDSQKLTKSKR